ncbi:DNA topology modulation protein [Paucisalibacillus globulus]|uniref:DNA topology modulation protein n=1 Tax=Paucisalibacillus globulus TaxID=351095 RepID=UPI0003FE125E|nr:DNA topology modulation protein [Paucisalibacillus globulus]
MKRITVIGSGGSGKSTMAKRLGSILNIDVYHLDALFWKPGWVGTSKEEQRKVQQKLVKQNEWIFDGNYGGTMDIRLNNADTIIFLNISRIICLIRIIKRRIIYRNKTRPDMAQGCEERLDKEFVKWVWNYPKDKKPEILKRLEKEKEEKEIIILSSPKEVEKFLVQLEESIDGN